MRFGNRVNIIFGIRIWGEGVKSEIYVSLNEYI